MGLKLKANVEVSGSYMVKLKHRLGFERFLAVKGNMRRLTIFIIHTK